MKNVMVCVTQQKTCDRLIRYGHDVLGDTEGELFIIHVAPPHFNFLGKSREGEALEYLYEKALEYGANLTVIRSEHVLDTLSEQIRKNGITQIIMGQSFESGRNNMTEQLKRKLPPTTELLVIPA